MTPPLLFSLSWLTPTSLPTAFPSPLDCRSTGHAAFTALMVLFGYGSLHLRTRGTQTLLIDTLLSAHYGIISHPSAIPSLNLAVYTNGILYAVFFLRDREGFSGYPLYPSAHAIPDTPEGPYAFSFCCRHMDADFTHTIGARPLRRYLRGYMQVHFHYRLCVCTCLAGKAGSALTGYPPQADRAALYRIQFPVTSRPPATRLTDLAKVGTYIRLDSKSINPREDTHRSKTIFRVTTALFVRNRMKQIPLGSSRPSTCAASHTTE